MSTVLATPGPFKQEPEVEPMEVAPQRSLLRDLLQPAVIVGALGYFVDIYDLTLFMAVREQSLRDLGLEHLIKGGYWYHDLMSW